MRYFAPALAVVFGVAFAVPGQAAETDRDAGKMQYKTIIVNTGDDENLVTLTKGDDGKLITISEDGKKRVLKLKDGKFLDLDDKLDTDDHLKLLDAKIAYLKATGSLKTDLAVRRVEVEKLELAKKPDSDVVAKKKEVNALKARLADARLDYEQAVKKLVPEEMADLYMLGLGDDTDMLALSLGLPGGFGRRIIKRIELRDDSEDSD